MTTREHGSRCRSEGHAHPIPHTGHAGADTQRNAADFHDNVCSDRSTQQVVTATTAFEGAISLPSGPASKRRVHCIRRPLLRSHYACRAAPAFAFDFTTFTCLFLAFLHAAGLLPLNSSRLRPQCLCPALNPHVLQPSMMSGVCG
jgi:hypothetical protein